jgi:hypothetical protein
MNSRLVFLLAAAAAAAPAFAEDKKPEPPVPVVQAPAIPASTAPTEGGDYQQRLYGPAAGSLVPPDRANQIVNGFRASYDKLGKPRILFYVNRELVDENGGVKLSSRTEKTETEQSETKSSFEADPNAPKNTNGTPQTQVNVAVTGNAGGSADSTTPGKGANETRRSKVTGENTYTSADKSAPTLADRQTVREVERLFGRPFRAAGVVVADQKTASSLIADKPLDHFTTPPTNESARKDREALAKIADVVIEVLVSSRSVNVAQVSGDTPTPVPDIQVTAIRLTDSAIIGQASASDVLGKDQEAGRIARRFDVRDITEATALALMEDMTTSAK